MTPEERKLRLQEVEYLKRHPEWLSHLEYLGIEVALAEEKEMSSLAGI
jgi:hypothetical protein